MRIVSLLPSATEIVCSLGVRDQLVGVTHECDYPPSVKGLPVVTRTLIPHDIPSIAIDNLVRKQLDSSAALYSLRMDVLERLKPDLIVTQALCDVCAVSAEEVCDAAAELPGHPAVINLEPMSLTDLYTTITMVAEAIGRQQKGIEVVSGLQERVEQVSLRSMNNDLDQKTLPSVMFLEWIDPPFCPGHWNPELIELAGGIPCIGEKYKPSRSVDWKQIINARPDVLYIACCGYDLERTFKDLDILKERQGFNELPCVKNNRVFVSDGNAYFSRPGPRLVDSLEMMANALHPDIHPLPPGIPEARNMLLSELY